VIKRVTAFFKIYWEIARIVSSFIFKTQHLKLWSKPWSRKNRPHPDSSGFRSGGTVDVRALSGASAIKIWGFIKAEGTLRVFYIYY
jgi:hypothetical protein